MRVATEKSEPLTWPGYFSLGDPYEGIHWVSRDAEITTAKGERIFYQKNVVAPEFWSDLAVKVVAQKYFRGQLDSETGEAHEDREDSIRQLVDRVADTIAGWAGYVITSDASLDNLPDGWKVFEVHETQVFEVELPLDDYIPSGKLVTHCRPVENQCRDEEVYFRSFQSWQAWKNDMKWLLIHQHVAFNSPVWFNVGVEDYPQCAACFIPRMEDTIEGPGGIQDVITTEGLIFKNGSGSGTNLSRIRSSKEWLSGGGRPSGPLSFAKTLDTQASTIKSGGKTRRAAIMRILDVDHPDIREFVDAKAYEERIAFTLRDAGYSADMDGEAYGHAFFQNANFSVRFSDEFMTEYENRGKHKLISRTSYHLKDLPNATTMSRQVGKVLEEIPAYDLMKLIAQRAWASGDPGVQFHDTINHWHTCDDTDMIHTSNPCSEYMFLDDTSCNLASFNLLKFLDLGQGIEQQFQVEKFVHAVSCISIAMEVIVPNSRYPTDTIRDQTVRYRTLGVGYANIGALFMYLGLSYDSDRACEINSIITSLMTSTVYDTSLRIARFLGPFDGYEFNVSSFNRVMEQHLSAHEKLHKSSETWEQALDVAHAQWSEICKSTARGLGPRNAQATVLAPTGTIAYFMDCATTGIEPEIALVKYKTLAGGGQLVIPSPIVTDVLRILGYLPDHIAEIASTLAEGKSIRRSTYLKPEHYGIFKTSFKPGDGDDFFLQAEAHIRQMAAAQPFLSGAISKTVNMPNDATVEDVMAAYVMAWVLGVKALAIYRDGCKMVQAVSTSKDTEVKAVDSDRMAKLASKVDELESLLKETQSGRRRRFPKKRVHGMSKFSIDGNEGYMSVGFFPDTWEVGEVFVTFSKENSTVHSLTAAICKCMSKLLQYGMPLEELIQDFEWTQFPPFGPVVDDPDVRSCKSIMDYIAKKMKGIDDRVNCAESFLEWASEGYMIDRAQITEPVKTDAEQESVAVLGESCPQCGASPILVRGRCIHCDDCGYDEGGCFL